MAQWEIHHDITESQFLAIHAHNVNHGFMARRISGYEVGGQRRYAAIWEKKGQEAEPETTWTSEHDVRLADYQTKFDAMVARGFRLVKVNGIPQSGDDARFATIWHKPHLSDADETFVDTTVRTFMVNHQMPGASVALTHHGRLVFARGYGIANPATNEPVTTNHLFRIASVSKPITAVAIFELIEAGQLQLGTRVFGTTGVLGTTYGTQPYGPNIDQITVQHLLEHTSGWPRTTDPMFGHFNLDQEELITWMLDNEPLTTVPGNTHDYLNFGYCVLGRIIERVSALSYTDYVQQHVLAPCGISDMHIAGDTLAERRGNEVVYVPQGGNPYGIRVSRMDAHGGWIASATALVRFLVRVDGFATKPDILASGSIMTMVTPTTALTPGGGATGYAKGWATNPMGNRWHDGDIPGTASILVRTHHEYCWAVLVNSRNDVQLDPMRSDLDNLMWTVIGRITDWPAFDLF
jgi:CubicO group peptidase (beta-lactamase class C family)